MNFPGLAISSSKHDYATTKSKCEFLGGHIISNLHTKRDFAIWQSLINPSVSNSFWYYGAHDTHQTKNYFNYDGTEMLYYWAASNGVLLAGEDCIVSIAPDGGYHDASCSTPSFARCQGLSHLVFL